MKMKLFQKIKELINTSIKIVKTFITNPLIFIDRVLHAGIKVPSFVINFPMLALIVGSKPAIAIMKLFLNSWFAESLVYILAVAAIGIAILKTYRNSKEKQQTGGFVIL